ncbi:MAG: Antilisterial bacteriocin subtilosin biosynthesis protein AlbA [Deltaproteobacteria bacterium ADurb.Bin510]|nr:MAG: Antilisterial bacteriocin subtilosin biosynthesis protein AlbA [Deltaproteobacteria bacterium ADurb.Bin510]
MKAPQLVALELTRACNLSCRHCRAAAELKGAPDELDTAEVKALLAELSELGVKMVILTGGEPLLRQDVFELAEYGVGLGLRMTLATNATLLSAELAGRIKTSGIVRVAVSLDGTCAAVHDEFRGQAGAFAQALKGVELLRQAGVAFQINTTAAAANIADVKRFPDFLAGLGAAAWHVFFLTPAGRGKLLEPAERQQYREMLEIFYAAYVSSGLECKATCAPQFNRLLAERGHSVSTKGCLAGTGFAFVSSSGTVQPCGFFEQACGNLREQSFGTIWESSKLLNELRLCEGLSKGCGACAYQNVCGGCRARALANSGELTAIDPICWWAHG